MFATAKKPVLPLSDVIQKLEESCKKSYLGSKGKVREHQCVKLTGSTVGGWVVPELRVGDLATAVCMSALCVCMSALFHL